MTTLSNIHLVPTNFAASFIYFHRHRWITISYYVFITLCIFLIISTLYYAHLTPDGMLFSQGADLGAPAVRQVWSGRAAKVKEAFRQAYGGYQTYSFPYDELMPMSNMSINSFNGWGITIVDSLDTMLLMGLEDEYAQALTAINNTDYSLSPNQYVPFFETVIRHLGGLLGAYALSGDDLLWRKADELGTKLAPVFDTQSGFPAYAIDTYNGDSIVVESGILAEIASFQMEYTYLGKITGKREYATLITNLFYTANLSESGGMYPARWDVRTGTDSPGKLLTVGAFADSAHEYTLKQFLMTARTDKRNLEMYLRFTSFVINNLLFLSPERHLLYVTDATRGRRWFSASHSFEHLSCFLPGLLALGVHILPLNDLDTLGIDVSSLADDLLPADRRAYMGLSEFNLADVHLWAAKGIAETCYMTYADQQTGLGPEEVWMDIDQRLGEIRWIDELRAWKARSRGSNRWWSAVDSLWGKVWEQNGQPPGVSDMKPWTSPVDTPVPQWNGETKRPLNSYGRDYIITKAAYYLRPETIESMYILWRTTGDIKWRHRGWQVFQAIERYTKTPIAYTSIQNVDTPHPTQLDRMPSYFLAETLKYLYLMFLDEDPLPLDKWVFNTEAHPLPVFGWTTEEREAYGIV